jgi:uncharacterized membrane protein
MPSSHWKNFIRCLCVCAVLAGVYFRLHHLDLQYFWEDETYSLAHVRVSRWEWEDFAAKISPVSGDALVQQLNSRQANFSGAMRDIFSISLPLPVYTLTLLPWIQMLGPSLWALRAYSALMGLLSIPLAGAVARSLSRPKTCAPWVAAAFFSVSPVFVNYCREGRHYGVWIFGMALSTAVTMRLLARNEGEPGLADWVGVSMAHALAIGANVLSLPISLSQLLLLGLLGNKKGWGARRWLPLVLATSFFLSEMALTRVYRDQHLSNSVASTTYAATYRESFPVFLKSISLGLTKVFLDLDPAGDVFSRTEHPLVRGVSVVFFGVLLPVLVGFLFYRLRPGNGNQWILAALLVQFLLFAAMAAATGAAVASVIRYQLPLLLAVLLATAYVVSRGVESERSGVRVGSLMVFLGLLFSSSLSSWNATRFDYWWYKYFSIRSRPTLEAIARLTSEDLVLVGSSYEFVTLAYQLKPGTNAKIYYIRGAADWPAVTRMKFRNIYYVTSAKVESPPDYLRTTTPTAFHEAGLKIWLIEKP